MSNAALTWAFPIAVQGPRKAVLIALAEHADAAGACWPSVQRLVLYSGICERAVRSALVDLESAKIITVDRKNGRAGRAGNHYLLDINTAPDTFINKAPHADLSAISPKTIRHILPNNKASHAENKASHAENKASHAPEPLEPSLTLKEPSVLAHAGKTGIEAEPLPPSASDLFGEKTAKPSTSKPKSLTTAKQLTPTASGAAIPTWVPADAWAGYLEMRKRKNKPPTDRAIELAIAKLAQFQASGHSIATILDQSTMNGWTDLYAPKDQHHGMNGQAKPNARQAAYDAIMGFDSTAPPPPADHDYIDLERGEYADA